MDINSKEDYLKGQEIVNEVRQNIKVLTESFDKIRAILADIDYIASYDVWAARELLGMLPKYINANYNKPRPVNPRLNPEDETRRMIRDLKKQGDELSLIAKYDPERARELSNEALSGISAMERYLKKE